MNYNNCAEIVFVDCMCNSGLYTDQQGNSAEGTPIRVARIFSAEMKKYPAKKASLYFNDLSAEKISELQKHLPENTANLQIYTSCKDGNLLLEELQSKLLARKNLHYLIFYDPYKAAINWDALAPYLFGWGEVIINHMVSAARRALPNLKNPETKRALKETYQIELEELYTFGNDLKKYEERVNNIIKMLLRRKSDRKYYITNVPFFITTNIQIYDIIFFTYNKIGFNTFKAAAWKTFGGKSSNKNTHGKEIELSLFEDAPNPADEYCYTVSDIADYLLENFRPRKNVTLEEIWALLEVHPIFPASYRNEIKEKLKLRGSKINRSSIDF